MKKNKLLLTLAAAMLSLLLLIPALVIPSAGAALTTKTYSFDTLSTADSVDAIKKALGGTTAYPSTLKVVTNPVGTDNVLRVESSYSIENGWTGGKDPNVDKNITVGNPEISYTDNDKIILQTEYFIPTGAKGSFESQIQSFSAVEGYTGSRIDFTWLNLLRIDLDSGMLKSGHIVYAGNSGSLGVTLEKNVWNTVSIVIDMDTGDVAYYINNILLGEGEFWYTRDVDGDGKTESFRISNLTFNSGRWIIAKLNKQSSGDMFGGCFFINNALMQPYTSSMGVDLSKKDALYGAMTVASGRTFTISGNEKILANKSVQYNTKNLSAFAGVVAPVEGASVRLTDAAGMRFATQLDLDKLDMLLELKKAGKIKDVNIGTLITPYEYAVKAGDITFDALKTLTYNAKYIDVKGTLGSYYTKGITLSSGYETAFVGSIVNVKPTNYDRLFTGVGYVRVTLLDGTFKYIYAYDYSDATTQQSKYSRSLRDVASVFVNHPDYAEYQDILKNYLNGLTVPAISSSYVKNVQYSYNEFFFQTSAGVACRLIYDGNNGWRFQAMNPLSQAGVYGSFDPTGAAQALSQYLGEVHDDVAMKLSVSTSSSKITVRAEGTDSYVTLNLTGSFNMQFYSPNGVVMNNVDTITANSGSVVIKGDLQSGEAIYGGGERFDAANKRGKYMTLYSYDAYNTGTNGEGTYTVIPLFTSSRGGGIYVNRYEYMTADWGNTSNGTRSSSVWEISINNDQIDCYFYATGKLTDAIKGYTDLAGHATLPEEWAQGHLVCRYSPDFNSLEGEQMYFDRLEDVPGYETLKDKNGILVSEVTSWKNGDKLLSGTTPKYIYMDGQFVRITKKGNPSGAGVKAIVEGLIDAGMKPDAMVLEGLGWTSLTDTARYENFVEVIEWLEAQGINTTLYMAVGEIGSGMPGYKPEYRVHARFDCALTYESGYNNGTYTYSHSFKEGLNVVNVIPRGSSNNPDATGAGGQSYLDVTNPEAVEWYMNVVWGQLIEVGIDGIKIDFCETMPNEGELTLSGTRIKNSNTTSTSTVQVGTATGFEYLWYDDSIFAGDEVHHAYSTYFISLFCKEMLEVAPEGFVVLSRGGGIGSQRNPYMWAGDQTREEKNLKTQLMAVINSGISGLPFMTYDMAGYAYGGTNPGYWGSSYNSSSTAAAKELESEIFVRAIQYSAFSLMIQTHGDVRHAYELTEEAQGISATYMQLHYDLMDYIQKYSKVACDTGIPVIRHMVIDYQNDVNVHKLDEQFMFGDALLVAPVLTLNTSHKDVYLPEGEWLDCLTGETYSVGEGGKHLTVAANIDQIPVFLKTDSEDANDLLRDVFNGDAWQSINGGYKFEVEEEEVEMLPEDPWEEDIFKK